MASTVVPWKMAVAAVSIRFRAYAGRSVVAGVEAAGRRSSCHSIRRLCDGLHGQ